MLLASRDVVGGIKWVEANKDVETLAKDAEKEKKNFAGTEIAGKKLGIIGLGAIGVKVANAAISLGMDVYGYDPFLSVDAAWSLSRDVKHVLNVDEIYETCDFITIHVPLMDSTKGMIDAKAIEKMKPGVILLNFARDLLANEKDVLEGWKLVRSENMYLIFLIQLQQVIQAVSLSLILVLPQRNQKTTVPRWQLMN